MGNLLELDGLTIQIKKPYGIIRAVRGVSFHLKEQETLAIVGESGSGKSILVKGIMGILPKQASITNGSVLLKGQDLTACTKKQMQAIRGADISMIFQDPMTALNPTMTIGKQIVEVLKEHRRDMNATKQKKRAIDILNLVGINNPDTRYGQYPHQLSGGMRQRVVIAIALACDPKILIADEPTTALDVTVQAQILDLMRDLQMKTKTSIIIITHNLGVVANIADRVAVMYGGKVVEAGGVRELFYQTCHPYTKGLLASIPKPTDKGKHLTVIPGSPPDLMEPPKGCPFAARCSETMYICQQSMPDHTECGHEHMTACWLLDKRVTHHITGGGRDEQIGHTNRFQL